MPLRELLPVLVLASAVGAFASAFGAPAPSLQLTPPGTPQLWQRAEFRVDGVPAVANPFDPDQIRVDAVFTAPSGKASRVPAFWFQDFTRSLAEGAEVLAPKGAPEWRVRFTPTEPGEWNVSLAVFVGGAAPAARATAPAGGLKFTIAPRKIATQHGWVRNAGDKRTFETSDGRPLRLIGQNVCWDDGRGTYEFDAWFGSLHQAGANFARLWLSPWSIGLEHNPGTLTNYPLGDSWQLDYVFDLAERHGIYLLIAFDHHGMYQVDNSNWGGSNNFWPTNNPYNAELGGPCAQPNDFFTNAKARAIYQKRLRYLVARWGHSPHLLAWQFFNEIDNVYPPRGSLIGDDVVGWHREMAQWLRANDPFGHLITTSLTGSSDRPEFWSLPEMDFAVYHSYNEANPGHRLAAVSDDFVRRYGKPSMIGEYGVDARSWNIASDPYLRGFRQALWGTALGGSVGASMSWWWQDIHTHDVYPLYAAMKTVLDTAKWQEGAWQPMELPTADSKPPELGDVLPEGEVFNAQLQLNTAWRTEVAGTLAVADRLGAERAAQDLSSYLQGEAHAARQRTMRLTAHFAREAQLVLRANAVAVGGAELIVRIDGAEVLRQRMPDLDRQAAANGEYNQEFAVAVPQGRHTVEIHNAGPDWVFIDQLRLEKVREARFVDGRPWTPGFVGLRSGNRGVVYAWSPWVAFPAGAHRFNPPALTGAAFTVPGALEGSYRVRWFDPRTGTQVGVATAAAKGGELKLALPAFREDLVGVFMPEGPSS